MDPNNFQPLQPSQPPVVTPQNPVMDVTSQQIPTNVAPGQQVMPSAPVQPVATYSPQQSPEAVVQPSAAYPAQQQGIPDTQQPIAPVIGGPTKKKPKFILFFAIALLVLVLFTVAALIFAKPKKTAAPSPTEQTQENKGPQPASAIDVEQSNNSINQDISSINTDDDFPTTQIDDKALGL